MARMTTQNIDNLLSSCNKLQQRTIYQEGCMHTSVRAFNACMREFDRENLSAEAVTFRIFLNAPIMKHGEATIHRDGRMEMRVTE